MVWLFFTLFLGEFWVNFRRFMDVLMALGTDVKMLPVTKFEVTKLQKMAGNKIKMLPRQFCYLFCYLFFVEI